jgi:Mn2+/Fe2+ NRAMP family transporter
MSSVKCPAAPAEVSARREPNSVLTFLGPAVITAAAGIGASDIIASSVIGARFGLALLWAIIVGAALKGLLSEGIARWQLASGTTLLEGVARHLPSWVLILFAAYLVIWSIGVAAALANGCGLAIENLSSGRIPRAAGALIHVLLAGLVVHSGGLSAFTKAMKVLLLLMFLTIIYCAATMAPAPEVVLHGLFPKIPSHAGPYIFSIIGGIGGSVTLLTYNYLPRSEATRSLPSMRLDIVIAYTLTALFGISIVVIASRVFDGVPQTDHDIITRMAEMLAAKIGPAGFYLYSLGFWAAVVASLLGTWQTIPLLVAESYALLRRIPANIEGGGGGSRPRAYTLAVVGITIAGVTFSFVDRPLALIVAYTIIASAIIPFLSAVLLYLNTRVMWYEPSWRNSPLINALLLLALILFLAAGVLELSRRL